MSSLQVAPFIQGLLSHSLMFVSQKVPAHPASHTHSWLNILSTHIPWTQGSCAHRSCLMWQRLPVNPEGQSQEKSLTKSVHSAFIAQGRSAQSSESISWHKSYEYIGAWHRSLRTIKKSFTMYAFPWQKISGFIGLPAALRNGDRRRWPESWYRRIWQIRPGFYMIHNVSWGLICYGGLICKGDLQGFSRFSGVCQFFLRNWQKKSTFDFEKETNPDNILVKRLLVMSMKHIWPTVTYNFA